MLFLYFVSFFVHLAILLLIGIGVLWAPVASGACFIIAKRRGLNAKQHALIGGVYSALLFFPWVYLSLRMLDIPVPKGLVGMAYTTLYFTWFIGVIVGAISNVEIASFNVNRGDEASSLLGNYPGIALILTGICLVTWFSSIMWIGWMQSPRGYTSGGSYARSGAVPRPGYVMPFALTAIWAALFAILTAV